MSKVSWRLVGKIVLRTLFYQAFIIFCLCSFSFTASPGWWGVKAMVTEMSFRNVFFPVSFDEACPKLKEYGEWRMWRIHNCPDEFEVIEHAYLAEEWYWCKFSYKDEKGNKIVEIDHFRVRWKTWENYYEYESIEDAIDTYQDLMDSYETPAAKESLKASKIRDEWLLQSRMRALKDITKVA